MRYTINMADWLGWGVMTDGEFESRKLYIWLKDNLIAGEWDWDNSHYIHFKNEEDALFFKLKFNLIYDTL